MVSAFNGRVFAVANDESLQLYCFPTHMGTSLVFWYVYVYTSITIVQDQTDILAGVALQLHFASQILLCLHEPCFGGLDTHLKRITKIQHCVNMICGVAMTLTDDASGLMSAQALFIGKIHKSYAYRVRRYKLIFLALAGMYIQDRQARICVLELINLCRQRTGWPATPLIDELKELWGTSDPSSILI
jgi:hypothetical protein